MIAVRYGPGRWGYAERGQRGSIVPLGAGRAGGGRLAYRTGGRSCEAFQNRVRSLAALVFVDLASLHGAPEEGVAG